MVQMAICPLDQGGPAPAASPLRFEQMMAAGLLAEVRACTGAVTCTRTCPPSGVGYRQLWRHLAGECSLEAAVTAARRRHGPVGQAPADLAAQVAGLNWIYTDARELRRSPRSLIPRGR